MNNQENFDDKNAENQFGYQEIHPDFKTDFSDIKMNRSGYPDFKDLPLWHKMVTVLFIIFCIPLSVMVFLGIVNLFSSGTIFYIIPFFVLACFIFRIVASMFPPDSKK